MKPYQSAWEVALYMRKYWKNKPVNIQAITDYFIAGTKRELEKITSSTIYDYKKMEDLRAWIKELDTWLCCWYTWIYEFNS